MRLQWNPDEIVTTQIFREHMGGDMPVDRIDSLLGQHQALLNVSKALATQRDLPSLLRELSEQLRAVVEFDGSAILLHDSARNMMRVHVIETSIPIRVPIPNELPVDASPGGWVWKNQQPVLLGRLTEDARFPRAIKVLEENAVKSYCAFPLNSAGRRLGTLAFTSLKEENWSETDVELLQQVA